MRIKRSIWGCASFRKSQTLAMSLETTAFVAGSAIPIDDNVIRGIVIGGSVMLLLVNLFVTFAGCKNFNTCLILQGVILGSFIGWYTGDAIGDSIGKHSPVLNIIASLGCGVFLGFFTCMLRLFMKFLFGGALGIQIGSVLNIVWLHNINSPVNDGNPNTLGYIAMALLGLLLGVTALLSGRKSHIGLTAWVGAYWVIQSIGNFIGNFPPMFYPFPESAPASVSITFYFYIGAWVVLALLGTVVQAQLNALRISGPVLDELDDIQIEKEYQKHTSYRQV
ncbi:Aste57867_8372 [Aphanomyces stellatus]|uniref:Transmembrane protein 198 n=1 Tax=Aphanomyces stellatus TaxID=120398 RepID=A0A485KK29_9STRA|nr:hypothetical protein As57867_008340 [Aphanomyces stellatus]VFT85258.1 Aste57867_8372 [Aphanomyces stellatus]